MTVSTPETATRPGLSVVLPTIFPALALNLLFHALGEITGYAIGKGDAENHYLELETRRFEAISAKDRKALGIQLPSAGR